MHWYFWSVFLTSSLNICCIQMPGKWRIVIHLKYLCPCFAKWASMVLNDALQAVEWRDPCNCQSSVLSEICVARVAVRALGPPAAVAGAGVGSSVSRITHRSLGSIPCQRSVCINGDVRMLLPYVLELILLVSVLVYSHSKTWRLKPVTSRNKLDYF